MGYGISIVNPYYFEDAINNNKLYIINKKFDFTKRKIILAKSKSNKNNNILISFENIIKDLVKNS